MNAGPLERTHSGLPLQLLYPLGGKVPGLARVPVSARRATRRALTAAAVRAHLARCRGTRLVAVTGSRGKSTLKDLLACMLAEAGPTLRTRNNDNGLYGVPATLLSIRPGDLYAVVEAGVIGPGDMPWIADLMRPEVAVLTGIADDHLPEFGSVERIAAEKRRLLERVPPTGTVVVNGADDRAVAAAAGLRGRVVLAGASADCRVRMVRARMRWPDGLDVEVDVHGTRVEAGVALHGPHLAPLVALAFAAAEGCGVPPHVAVRGLARFNPPSGRLQPAPGPRGTMLLVDDFKCRAGTALAALATLAEIPAKRRVVVMGELQERAATPEAYAEVGAAMADVADVAIAVGNAGEPLRAILGGAVRVARDPREVAALLEAEAGPGVVALLTGATAQHLQRARLLLAGSPVGCHVRRCRLRWECTDCPYLRSGPPQRVVEAA